MVDDWELSACLKNNPQEKFNIGEVEKILAVWEGTYDGDDYRWVLQLSDGRFVFLQGWCDYTGWDCRSAAESTFADSAEEAAKLAIKGDYDHVYKNLLGQLESRKTETWREKMDKEFRLNQGGK